MKAAILFEKGGIPRYTEDFPEPAAKNDKECLLFVKAVSIKHFDKLRAAGKHYAAAPEEKPAQIIGGDGVGLLEDSTRVFAFNGKGMMAEKAIVEKNKIIPLPDGIDDAAAAALPNAVAGSVMALRFRAGMKEGETVLINGATGFTGKTSVQVAKLLGAKKTIATGRNEESLQALAALGAHEIVSLKQDDEQFITQIQKIHRATPVDIVIDYLWGHTATLLLQALKGNGSFTHKTRFVSVGAMTGDTIVLSSEILRSTDLYLAGSGIGSWTKEEIQQLFHEILPQFLQMAADHKLIVNTQTVHLQDIAAFWDTVASGGKRLVVLI
ncbi:alcohol dehydrogenase [Niabella ginsenosidivorans]|uniref:Alcohol dehydrogenase n=1 Tax=Niabella ginsenosidivorans TaxID=1176587 RepID=A0A1A9I6Y7_9BACT|nr:zinc-binding dehydrogenase [Niabella ginsenosidivorans]ANH82304.1 alcohol dehydrogenase [Niabella ginsenosidivorans]